MLVVKIVVFLIGLLIIFMTIMSVIRVFVLPRSAPDYLVRACFLWTRRLFGWRLRLTRTYEERDRIMAFYAPISLIVLLPFWLILILVGFMLMFWAAGVTPFSEAFLVSGSSLLTLGFAKGEGFLNTVLTFAEATLGLIFVAVLIAYLPTMYSAFAQREHLVTLLDTYAGSPPSPIELVLRINRIGFLDNIPDFWISWESWFGRVAESHTSFTPLVFFRSPLPEHSWVNAAGAVMDAGALLLSIVDVPWNPRIALCIRAGYIALQRIAAFFRADFNPKPYFPQEAISITREEFNEACDRLAAAGVPLKKDRDQAWQDFGGWRVNYDTVLLALCSMTMAPEATWSSDRAPAYSVPRLFGRSKKYGVRETGD